MAVSLRANTERDMVNTVFLDGDECPWDKFPQDLIREHRLNKRAMLFYQLREDCLLHLIRRQEPQNPDRFIGNFPLSRDTLEWLVFLERQRGISLVLVATVEQYEQGPILGLARAGEVQSRVPGFQDVWVNRETQDEYYRLDQDLFPVHRPGPRRKKWRELAAPPLGLRQWRKDDD